MQICDIAGVGHFTREWMPCGAEYVAFVEVSAEDMETLEDAFYECDEIIKFSEV